MFNPTRLHLGLLGILAVMLSACTSESAETHTPLETAGNFEVTRYMGKWHQVAYIPAWFQRRCASDTSATYALVEDDRVQVTNACKDETGADVIADGQARFQKDPATPILEVTFVNFLDFWFWPAAGNYWVIGLDADYRWAVVGEPSRQYAWVLARDQSISEADIATVHDIFTEAGYDTCAIMLTVPDASGTLCDRVGDIESP